VPEPITRDFSLFPLGIVALPSESVPLHIFEARYRQMIERCLHADAEALERQFGIVWLSDQELKPVGCACEIEQVLERMEDGRMNILARGTRPFRLLERQDELPYPAGTVEFLTDSVEEADVGAASAARELYRELVEQATDRSLTAEELSEMDAYRMAATVEFGVDAKQELLELRSENARLHLLTLLLRAAIKRLELVERAETRARSNGKVRFA
jgi:Lon protease-like protein